MSAPVRMVHYRTPVRWTFSSAPRLICRKASGGVIFSLAPAMTNEPPAKRAVAFIDGQNLFHAAKDAFGCKHPDFDPRRLALAVCRKAGWDLVETRFYTGYPDATDNAFWNHFWAAKMAQMGRDGVRVFSRKLRYRNQTVRLPDGSIHTFLVGQEKGIDVRIALDILDVARRQACDVLLVFSQDQDLSEVADDMRAMAREQARWIKIASAFPDTPASRNRRGINGSDWIRIDRPTYDSALDPRDYRPKPPPP